jgi:hypothetical protein
MFYNIHLNGAGIPILPLIFFETGMPSTPKAGISLPIGCIEKNTEREMA